MKKVQVQQQKTIFIQLGMERNRDGDLDDQTDVLNNLKFWKNRDKIRARIGRCAACTTWPSLNIERLVNYGDVYTADFPLRKNLKSKTHCDV